MFKIFTYKGIDAVLVNDSSYGLNSKVDYALKIWVATNAVGLQWIQNVREKNESLNQCISQEIMVIHE